MLRSFLFIPADSERKLAKAPTIDADALILDLEDAVVPAHKAAARDRVAAYLAHRKPNEGPAVWVRINALDTAAAALDLAAVVPAGPDGIVLPKAHSAQQVRVLASELDALEADTGQTVGQIGVIPLVTETAAAVFQLASYTPGMARLRALTWGAEDLSVDIGAVCSRDQQDHFLPVFQQVQSMVLLAAGVACVPAIETLYSKFTDGHGLRQAAGRARQQGFTGMLAIHPDQVPIINAVFAPNKDDIAYARRVVEKFSEFDGAGVIELDGRMLDQPHLRQAKRLLDSGE